MTPTQRQVLEKVEKIANEELIPIVCPATRQFLIGLIKSDYNILEIGTAIGYSGILMLASTSGTKLTTVEVRTDRVAIATQNFIKAELSDRVTIVHQDALDFALANKAKFDFMFLDGAVQKYVHMYDSLKSSLNSGGTIVLDNAIGLNRAKKKCGEKLMAKMNDFKSMLNSDPDFKTQLHEVGDGILVAQNVLDNLDNNG